MKKDHFGFWFWLGWIVWFAASFAAAAVFWTALLKLFFGPIRGGELAVTWAVSVFGSWFILLIPFMRKKEQIWKRLNSDQENAVDAWIRALGIFVGLFVTAALFWSFRLKSRILSYGSWGLDHEWAKAVFGSWLVMVIPFLILMYRKADAIFKTAVVRQTGNSLRHGKIFLEKSRRVLSRSIVEKLKTFPPTLPKGHVVTAVLKDGRKVPDVFVFNASEMLGVYDRDSVDFDSQDILDIELTPLDQLPPYEESKWLRLDG